MDEMACENCKNEDRIRQLELDSERNQKTHKEFFGRFEKLERENAVTDERYQQLLVTMNEIKADVRELKDKPRAQVGAGRRHRHAVGGSRVAGGEHDIQIGVTKWADF